MAVQFGVNFPLLPVAFESSETLTQSTATVPQNLDPRKSISILGMGTATSFIRNQYNLATTNVPEGAIKAIYSLASGEAQVFVAGPTNGRLPLDVAFEVLGGTATAVDTLLASATGRYVFKDDGDVLMCQFLNGTWHPLYAKGPTQATST